jgi:ABC-type multidrug transport system permease subunit
VELSKRLHSRHAYLATALISAAGVVYLWMNLTGNDPGAFRGLTQRIFSSIASAWPFLATYWLVNAERSGISSRAALTAC